MKTSLKSEFEFFSRSLLRLFQLSYSNVCEPSPEAEVVQLPPTAKNCTKNKCDACANFSTFACVLSTPGYSHHLAKCYPLSHQLYLLYLAVFFTWVLCLTLKFEAHDQNMNLQKFSRLTEKGSNAYILQFCFKHTLAF